MALPRTKAAAKAAAPCAVCGQPGPNRFYEVGLCNAHLAQWMREAPTLQSLEYAHAVAHPEDVEASGENRYVEPKRWFILKPGVAEHLAKTAATSWLLRLKARAA